MAQAPSIDHPTTMYYVLTYISHRRHSFDSCQFVAPIVVLVVKTLERKETKHFIHRN